MRNAIIVHGRPSKEQYYSDAYPTSSNFAWIPWLQKQLVMHDIKADAPEMPFAFEPDYALWKKEFERFEISSETILVGHSAGGGFLVRWLSENKGVMVDKVLLVAPSVDPIKKSKTGFCDFLIDSEIASRTKELVIITSDNDSDGINESVRILKGAIPGARVVVLQGFGHFIPDHMGKSDFPELLQEIVKQ